MKHSPSCQMAPCPCRCNDVLPYKRDCILQKRLIILRSLLSVATPYEWGVLHIWMSHFTHKNKACHTYQEGLSHIWESYVTHMNGFIYMQVKMIIRSTQVCHDVQFVFLISFLMAGASAIWTLIVSGAKTHTHSILRSNLTRTPFYAVIPRARSVPGVLVT